MSNSIVIVTNQCYLLAKHIHWTTVKHVTSDNTSYGRQPDRGTWYLEICFTPEDGTPSNISNQYLSKSSGVGDHNMVVGISVTDAATATKLHQNICDQIRQHLPDKMILNEAVEKILSGEPLHEPISSPNKVYRTRKTKRKGKKVLRRTKGRKRRSR